MVFVVVLVVVAVVVVVVLVVQRVYKSSQTDSHEISRTHLTKVPAGFIFTSIESPKFYNMGYKHMHFQLCTTL